MVGDRAFIEQQLTPQRSQILAQFLAQQKQPTGITPAAGGADLASNLIDAFTQKKLLQSEQARETASGSELANILGSQTVEGAVPSGQIGPGAPVQQAPTLEGITQGLLGSQDPRLQQLGVQQQLSSLQSQQDTQGVIGAEKRAEQTQIRKEERAAKLGGDLGVRKLALEERKFQQTVKEFDQKLAGKVVDPKDLFEGEQKLRKEYTSLSKEFIKQRDGFTRVQASAQDPSAAGDLALIFNFMKVLDPGSVVRESEFRTAADAGALTDRVAQNAYDRIITGRRLAPNQRDDFVNRAGIIFQSAEAQHEQRTGEFTRISNSAGFDPQNVVISLGLAEQQAAEEQAEPALGATGDVDAMTEEELDAIIAGGR